MERLLPILENLQLGVFTFDAGLAVLSVHSSHVATLLGAEGELVGRPVADLLLATADLDEAGRKRLRFQLSVMFPGDRLQWEMSAADLPSFLSCGERHLRLRFCPDYDDADQLRAVTVLLEDVTELRKAELAAAARNQDMIRLAELLAVDDDVFQAFSLEAVTLFGKCGREVAGLRGGARPEAVVTALNALFRYVHTFKGNARLFKLTSAQNAAHAVEEFLANLRSGARPFTPATPDEIAAQLAAIQNELQVYFDLRTRVLGRGQGTAAGSAAAAGQARWLASLVRRSYGMLRNLRLGPHATERLRSEVEAALQSIGNKDLQAHLTRYDEMLADIAARLGKSLQPLTFHGNQRYFSAGRFAKLSDMLVHCLRNAVDHGIEPPEARTAAGKDPAGQLRLGSSVRGETHELRVSDDGRGIDTAALSRRAVANGLLTAEAAAALPEAERVRLIFAPGLSTAPGVTDVSGRGVGMDAVARVAEELGGTVDVETEPGRGTTIVIRLPKESVSYLPVNTLFDVADELVRASDGLFQLKTADGRSLPALGDRPAVRALAAGLCQALGRHARGGTFELRHGTPERLAGSAVDDVHVVTLAVSDPPSRAGLEAFKAAGELRALRALARTAEARLVLEADGIRLAVPANLPVPFARPPLRVLLKVDDAPDVAEVVARYCAETLGGWPHQLYAGKEARHFFDEPGPEGAARVVVADHGELRRDQRLLARLAVLRPAVLVVAEDPARLDPELLTELPDDHLVLPAPLDAEGLAQALDVLALREIAAAAKAASAAPADLPAAS